MPEMTKSERARMQALEAQVMALTEKEEERDQISRESPREKEARDSREQQIKKIIDNLEELGGKMFDDEDDILFQGSKLVIPSNMSLQQAGTFIENKIRESETITAYNRTFNYRPWDGAWCMWQVMKRLFGAVNHRNTVRYGIFGAVNDPPQMITINSDVGRTDQVPWGRFEIPFLPGVWFETDKQNHPEYGPLFSITAEGPKKYRYRIEGVFTAVEQELQTNSLYRGKAFDGQTMPEFVDVFGIDRSKVVYSEDVEVQLDVNIWSQLRYTEASTQAGVTLKRAVLVHGPFGTGKTLALMLTGQEAVANGWTFIKARPGRDNLMQVLQTARLYQPAVVAYEDLDAIAGAADSEDRNMMIQLLDAFDGIEAKNTKILCVLTTNYPDRISKGMTRPGRLDGVIEINELDQTGVMNLVKVRIPETSLEEEIDWERVFEDAQGYKPAFVTEFAERAVRYALVRSGGQLDGVKITTEDLCFAAKGLRPQYNLMEGAKDLVESESLGTALDRRVETVLRETLTHEVLNHRER